MHCFYWFLIICISGSVCNVFFPQYIAALSFLWLCTLILREKAYLLRVNKRLLIGILSTATIVVLNTLINRVSIGNISGILLKLIMIFFTLHIYTNRLNKLKLSIYSALKFILYLSVLNYVLVCFTPFFFSHIKNVSDAGAYEVDSWFYFFNKGAEVTLPFLNIKVPRNYGMFWEPGVLQIHINILFFMTQFIYRNKPIAIASAFIIFTTFSTTGFVILFIQLLCSYLKHWKKFIFSYRILPMFLFIFIVLSLVINELKHKLLGEGMGSFLLRQYDTLLSLKIIKDNPVWGIGFDGEKYKNLSGKYYIQSVEAVLDIGNDGRGNTNGILSLFVCWGIPVGILLMVKLFKQRLFLENRLLFFIIITLSLSSEPLLITPFFLIFFLSFLIKNSTI